MSRHTYIIAEIGLNHNGSIKAAKELINVAKSAGVDAVKFQLFCQPEVPSVWDSIKKYYLPPSKLMRLRDYAESKGLDFLCSTFGIWSTKALSEMKLRKLKIPSGKIANDEYLKHASKLFDEFILSTGMSTMMEVKRALDILGKPTTALHCVSAYPAPMDQMNLLAIQTMKKRLKCPVGLSDHSEGILASVIAVSLGAVMIEKHITLDRDQEGPDHKCSLVPVELFGLVQAIRDAEKSLGTGRKEVQKCEMELLHRKSE